MNDVFKNFFIFLINAYKHSLAVLLGGNCRFYPSCSDYAVEAIKSEPAHRAFVKIVYRILRCNPWSEGGIDFVKK